VVELPDDGFPSALGAYLQALDELDRRAAVSCARELATAGHPPTAIVERVLVPAQVEVGARWEAGLRSVAWEHAATAITEQVLLSLAPPPGSSPAPAAGPGPIVITCAMGEEHLLAARMATELLRWEGCEAVYVGGTLDAGHLAEFLRDRQAVAVGVSCTLTGCLPGAVRIIESAHRAGLPVLAGGAAFDAGLQRARIAGADGWAGEWAETAGRIASWTQEPPARLAPTPELDPPLRRLTEGAAELASDAMAVLARQLPDWPLDWSETNTARQDFAHIIGLLAASLLLRDEQILHEGLVWRRGFWTAHGESSTSLRTRASALAAVLPSVSPEALGMLRAAEDTD
jgi:methanogenic corrinoid protein MtbC1